MQFELNAYGRPEIPTGALDVAMVPRAGATYLPDIVDFALTFDGYARHPERLADLACSAYQDFLANGKLPRNTDQLRAYLFFQQRFWRAQETDPDADSMRFIEAMLALIRKRVAARPSTAGRFVESAN